MNFASIAKSSLIIILGALPAQAANLAPLPASPNGIELPADHTGVQSMIQSFAKDHSARVNLAASGLENASGLLAPARAGSATEAAKAFVAGKLGLRVAGSAERASAAAGHQLVVDRALENLGTNHIRFRHEVAGIPVRGEEVAVHLNADNSVSAVNGSYHELPSEMPAHTISDADAAARAVAHLNATSLRQATTTQRAWLPVDGKLQLVVLANVAAAQPLGDFEVAIDAETGKVVGGEDHLQFEHAPVSDPGRETATGKIYAHSPLDHDMVQVALTNLNSKDKLVGAYVKVVNEDVDGAISSTGEFNYDEGNTHFAEVMVYRNLEMVHSYYKSLGFTGRDKQMKATVHYGDKYDNAFYSPMSDSMAFGDGNRLNNLSLEDNVAFHEYTHGVNRLITGMGGAEGGAMNEATSDYFACTMTGSPLMGVWVMRKMNRPFMRNLENKKHYPEDIHNEVHADGEIWGGVLWDLRKAFGAGPADRMIFKSAYNLPSRPSFKNGLEAILTADKQLNNGANAAKITEIFRARGITTTNNAPSVVARQGQFLSLFND